MANEPDVSTHLYPALNKCSQKSDKESEIELYYSLLSAGHSVGEILGGIGSAQGKAERGNATTAKQPRSGSEAAESDEGATDPAAEAAMAEVAQGNTPSKSRPNAPDTAEWHGIAEPQPARAGEFPGATKRIAFGLLYTAAVASVSIAGFSIVHGGRGTVPAITRAHPDVPRGTEALAIPSPPANGPIAGDVEATAEAAKPKTQKVTADALPAPEPSRPGEPEPAAAAPSQPISAGIRETLSSTRRGAELPQPPSAGQPDAIGQTIYSAEASRGLEREPTALSVQFPSATSAGPAATAPRANRRQPDQDAPRRLAPRAAPKHETKTIAAVPTGKVAAASPSRAQIASRREASTTRRHTEPRRYARRQTPAAFPQPASHGQRSRPYDADPTRGYGNGAYGPAAYSDNGN